MAPHLFEYVTLVLDINCHKLRPMSLNVIHDITNTPEVKRVWVRCGVDDEVEVKVELYRKIDFWTLMILRALWGDKAERIKGDLVRYYKGKPVNTLWDTVGVCLEEEEGGCEVRQAKRWILIWDEGRWTEEAKILERGSEEERKSLLIGLPPD